MSRAVSLILYRGTSSPAIRTQYIIQKGGGGEMGGGISPRGKMVERDRKIEKSRKKEDKRKKGKSNSWKVFQTFFGTRVADTPPFIHTTRLIFFSSKYRCVCGHSPICQCTYTGCVSKPISPSVHP